MLCADKLQLQSALKQQATALKEKEFSLHHNNLMTVGTQAAVLAGLDITMFIEFNPPHNSEWQEEHRIVARTLKMIYYGIIVAAFCANITVVAHTTVLSVLGGSLALRGPDGSMMTATDVLYNERKSVFHVFGIGLASTIGSVLVCVWILLPVESALICWLVALMTSRRMYNNYRRVQQALEFDERDTVDFRDIFDGPAAIRVTTPNKNSKNSNHNNRQQQYHHSGSIRHRPSNSTFDDDYEDDQTSTSVSDENNQQNDIEAASLVSNDIHHQHKSSRRRNRKSPNKSSNSKHPTIQTV